jgi:hypothetical protein
VHSPQIQLHVDSKRRAIHCLIIPGDFLGGQGTRHRLAARSPLDGLNRAAGPFIPRSPAGTRFDTPETLCYNPAPNAGACSIGARRDAPTTVRNLRSGTVRGRGASDLLTVLGRHTPDRRSSLCIVRRALWVGGSDI